MVKLLRKRLIMKNYIIGILLILLLAVSVFFIYKKLYPVQLPPNLIAGAGRIDGDIIALNTKYSGRIKSILIEDGQRVKKGDIIALIKSEEFEAKLLGIDQTVQSSLNRIKALYKEYDLARLSIPLMVEKAEKSLDISLAQKEELLCLIDNQRLVVEQDKRDYNRVKKLFKTKIIAKNLFEHAALKLDNSAKQLESLKEKLKQADRKIEISGTDIKIAKARLNKIKALKANIDAAKNHTAFLKANKKEMAAIIKELTIVSPADSVVIEKVAQIGEVLSPGMVIATLIDPNELYLKMFIDTIDNGKIKLHDKAVIFLDSYPDTPIEARVVRIAQRAEFTPKEVNVKSDRIQRMYAVHLKPVRPDLSLKFGIPAVGVITIDGHGLPESSKILGDL